MEADNFPFALSFEQSPIWADYLARLDAAYKRSPVR
jgi:hypothetical protein